MPVRAQSPSTDSVAVPDWVPADSVNPWIEVSAHRDTKTGFWRYIYRVHNRQPATQALTKLGLLLLYARGSAPPMSLDRLGPTTQARTLPETRVLRAFSPITWTVDDAAT